MVRSSGSRQGCCTTPRRASTAWQPSSFSSSSFSSSSFSSCSADDQGSSRRKSPGEISRGEITAGASDAKLGMTNLTPIVPNSLPKTTGFEGSSSKETDFFRDLLCLHKHVKKPVFLCSQRDAHTEPLPWDGEAHCDFSSGDQTLEILRLTLKNQQIPESTLFILI